MTAPRIVVPTRTTLGRHTEPLEVIDVGEQHRDVCMTPELAELGALLEQARRLLEQAERIADKLAAVGAEKSRIW